LAVKYSDSVRWYIIWAAKKAICRRIRSSAMKEGAPDYRPSKRRRASSGHEGGSSISRLTAGLGRGQASHVSLKLDLDIQNRRV
jgi:hypothetical protein